MTEQPGSARPAPGRARVAAGLAADGVLWVGALLGLAGLVLVVAGWLLGTTALVVRSGSMEPTIGTGALALARPVAARDVEVGDVVSVVAPSGQRVTHRVVGLRRDGEVARLTLRGDANSRPDAEPYTVSAVDRVVVAVPVAGRVVAVLSSPVGRGLSVAVLGGAVAVRAAVRRRRGGTAVQGRHAATTSALLVAGAVLLPGVASGGAPANTLASFTDTATATSATFAAHAVVSQAQPGCADVNGVLVLGNVARVSWTQVDRAYEYTWELRTTSTGALVASGVVGTGAAAGSPVSVDIGTALLGTADSYQVVVRARLAGTPAWVATTTTSTAVRRQTVAILGVSVRCGA